METKDKKSYWPHMILGFLAIGLTLGYWTIKSANALPVQESNDYMLKYQQTDIHINDILEKKQVFDKGYFIEIQNIEMMVMIDNINSKLPQPNVIKLSLGTNNFSYTVVDKAGAVVNDANVSFLLTRPHTRTGDVMQESVAFSNGQYHTEDFDIQKAGRYTLQLRAKIDKDTIGYSSLSAYLVPLESK